MPVHPACPYSFYVKLLVVAVVVVVVVVLVLVLVFDCLLHSLLIAKFSAYGFDKTSTEYLKDYLNHRKLKIKINKTFSNWTNILIFNVFLCDLFCLSQIST